MESWFKNGVFLAVLSSLFFSICSLISKFLVELHPIQLSWFSFLGIAIVSGASVLHHKKDIFLKDYKKLLVCRSLFGTIFLFSSFYSVQHIPLGDASVLFYTAPAFTLILAKWLIKEPCSIKNFFLIFAMMACVMLIMKPQFIFGSVEMNQDYIFGVLMAITASLTDALSNITLKKLSAVHFSVIMFNYSVISLIFTSIISVFFSTWTAIKFYDCILVLILVLLNLVEQILMTLALKFEKAGPVAIAQASDIIYGYVFQIIFFKDTIDLLSIIGAIIIALMIISISMKSKKRKNDFSILKF